MKKERLRLLVFVLLASVFFISFISFNVNSQPVNEPQPSNDNKPTVKALETLGGAFSDFFSSTGWSDANMAPNVAKIFFFIMIALIIYLILSNFFKHFNNQIVFIISVIVAFLSTAYITPKDVYSLLASYTSLGLTLTTLVPLIIIGSLTYTAIEKGNVQLIMMQWFAWILFGAFSLYRFLYDIFKLEEGSTFTSLIILGSTLVAVIMIGFNKQIVRSLTKKFMETQTDEAGSMMREVWKVRKAERDAAREATS